RHTRFSRDWSSDVCSSDLTGIVQIKFFPTSTDKLTGANKGHCHQLHRQASDAAALVDLNAPQQVWQLLGIQPGIVLFFANCEDVAGADIRGRVTGSVTVRNSISKNLTTRLQRTLGDVERPSLFDDLDHLYYFGCVYLIHRARPQAREHIRFKTPNDVLRMSSATRR